MIPSSRCAPSVISDGNSTAIEAITVRRARNAGASWQLIALCLEVSRQAVHKRYGRS